MFQIAISSFFLLIGMLCQMSLSAQSRIDSASAFPYVKFQYAYLYPSGEFETTFGNSSSLGGALGYKTKSNWIFELDAGYLFGGDVKSQNLLSDIINQAGDVTDADGELVKIIYDLRGLSFTASVGKIFPIRKTNPNSGIVIKVGAGYLQHRIKVDYRDGQVFQLNEEMLKGYDHLHTGLLLSQFVGFQYFGKKNFTNFVIGFEFNEGFTKNRREYNYDSRSFDKGGKKDFLYGFRVGWIIPIRSRASEEYYFY